MCERRGEPFAPVSLGKKGVGARRSTFHKHPKLLSRWLVISATTHNHPSNDGLWIEIHGNNSLLAAERIGNRNSRHADQSHPDLVQRSGCCRLGSSPLQALSTLECSDSSVVPTGISGSTTKAPLCIRGGAARRVNRYTPKTAIKICAAMSVYARP
jgi:hypothetical protein